MSQKDISRTSNTNHLYQRRPSMFGEKNPRWNGGTSEYPDHYLLKKVRIEKLKAVQCKCEICGNRATVVHHIDETTCNHSFSNLLAVCSHCHSAIHSKEGSRKTSKYIRIYGMTLKDLTKMTGLYTIIIMEWTKNPVYRQLLIQAIRDGKDADTIRKKVDELWIRIKDEDKSASAVVSDAIREREE